MVTDALRECSFLSFSYLKKKKKKAEVCLRQKDKLKTYVCIIEVQSIFIRKWTNVLQVTLIVFSGNLFLDTYVSYNIWHFQELCVDVLPRSCTSAHFSAPLGSQMFLEGITFHSPGFSLEQVTCNLLLPIDIEHLSKNMFLQYLPVSAIPFTRQFKHFSMLFHRSFIEEPSEPCNKV